ncbi:hypothetical protein INT47_011967 [Mucor saturninus]|uniref:Uncharacterized protein n=1 Tax=Mucor saturninus TaxID=64648 RepID=A0A8H7R6E2_9FUNG|nr:hypothetical protein INT47_011967 [Mucor saturninus]
MSLARPLTRIESTPINQHANDFASMLQLSSKRGMQVTWLGLASNVGLTLSKGTAGFIMNSASLLADAAHSLSGNTNTPKVPDAIYPYGYGRYETIGSLSVSGLLMGGGVGIGLHSFHLLLATLDGTLVSSGELDPNAAWFALGSVVIKEWLYRITYKVGKSERSDVLIANAWHHRSDAYSSFVALMAIGGTYAGVPMFDPLGGIVVSCMILKSGASMMSQSSQELLDKSISEDELNDIQAIVASVKEKEQDLLDFYSIRGRKFGPFQHLDLTLQLNPDLAIYKAHAIEQRVRQTIKANCGHVQEVIIHIDAEKQPRHF